MDSSEEELILLENQTDKIDQGYGNRSFEQFVEGLFYEQFKVILYQRDFILDYGKRSTQFKKRALEQKNGFSLDQLFKLIESISQN